MDPPMIEQRPYRHYGIHIPFVDSEHESQWSADDAIFQQGFIFIDHIIGTNAFIVQSVGTGQLYVNKLVEPDNYADPAQNARLIDEPSEELRISTAPYAQFRLLEPLMVRGIRRTYFVELDLHQDIGNGTDSLYFKFYNGGTLETLRESYVERQQAIPESFVWHVLLTLIEAVRYLMTGARPGTDDEIDGWNPICHRDINLGNIFVHYPARDPSEEEPVEGFQDNAFPEVILGNFGRAAVEGDDVRKIRLGRWNEDVLAEWHDTYAIISVVKMLCLSHLSDDQWAGRQDAAPESVPCQRINPYMSWLNRPYSGDLLHTLSRWEYENCEISEITDMQPDDDGIDMPNSTRVPDLRYLINRILPLARRKVRTYRKMGPDKEPDWYRLLDVSWTKPKRLMPYEWWPVEEDNIPIPPPPPSDDDDQSDNGQSDDDQGGDGQGGNSQGGDDQGGDDQGDNSQNGDGQDGDGQDGDDQGSDGQGDGGGQDGNGDLDGEDPNNGSQGGQDSESSLVQLSSLTSSSTADSKRGPNGPWWHKDNSANHHCPIPNPYSERTKLANLEIWEIGYPTFRPPNRIVFLSYGVPMMYDIRDPPYQPGPDIPDSLPPSPSDSDSDSDSGGGAGGGGGGSGSEFEGEERSSSDGSDDRDEESDSEEEESDDSGDGGNGSGGGGGGGGRGGRGGRGGGRGKSGGGGGGRGGKNTGGAPAPPQQQPTRRSTRQGRFQGSYKDHGAFKSEKAAALLASVYKICKAGSQAHHPKKKQMGANKIPIAVA
ncbi:hypothetical protein GGR58DRAFT_529071 [Xylaria digitata]|nr:hypothetical protein GGR58DRAFT_529071 [Xylaria digitata]